jgi:hypothetical protein
LACVLFAAAAWKVQARDAFIGWSAPQRQQRLSLTIAPGVALPDFSLLGDSFSIPMGTRGALQR